MTKTYFEREIERFDEKFPIAYFHNIFQNKGESIFRDEVYPVDIKSFLADSHRRLIDEVMGMVEKRSYVGVLESNEKRRGYDLAWQEITHELQTLKDQIK